MNPGPRLILLVLGLAAPAGAWAQVAGVPAVVLDRALEPSRVQLLRVDVRRVEGPAGVEGRGAEPRRGEFVVVDASGKRRTLAAGEVLAIVPVSWIGPADAAGMLDAPASPASVTPALFSKLGRSATPWVELVDGQVFTGRPAAAGAEDAGEGPAEDTQGGEPPLVWRHERFGTLTFPLERVSHAVLEPRLLSGAPQAAAALESPRTVDSVRLSNGDRVDGFVEEVGSEIVIERSGGGRATIPLARAATVTLGSEPVRASGPTVWLADGSVVAVGKAASDGDEGRVTLALPSTGSRSEADRGEKDAGGASFQLVDLRAVVVDAGVLTPLALLPMLSQTPTTDRPGAEPARVIWGEEATSPGGLVGLPPVLSAADVVLPGPMSVRWSLPAGASRVAGWAHLEEENWDWGDCTVVLKLVGERTPARELARGRVYAKEPSFRFSVDLSGAAPGDALSVRIEPGPTGPVQDRVVLKRVLVLTQPIK